MTARPTIAERLAAMPHRFDGLQAVRLAELGPGEADAAVDGADAAPGPTHIAVQCGLAFAPSPVAAVEASAGGTLVRTAFLGLTGPMGVLPQAYGELVQRADRQRNEALPAFLDLFNHRLTTLFLQASEKYRLSLQVQRTSTQWPAQRLPTQRTSAQRSAQRSSAQRSHRSSAERTAKSGGAAAPSIGTDAVSQAMLALAGLGTPHLSGRMEIADEVVLYYAGLFSARNRPACALQDMLADYLGIEITVEQFAGRWLPIVASEQTRLPGAGETPRYCALGVDAVAGGRVWDVQSGFRIVVGPVDYPAMLDLMPDQPLLRRLVDLVRIYAGADLTFDVQVILHRDAVPALEMSAASGQTSPRLGWNTWLQGLPALEHKRDILLDPDVVMQQKPPSPGARKGTPVPGKPIPGPQVVLREASYAAPVPRHRT